MPLEPTQYKFDRPTPSRNAFTFSFGIYREVPNKSGKRLIKEKAICRVRGFAANPGSAFKLAESLCEKINSGWIPPDKKVFSV